MTSAVAISAPEAVYGAKYARVSVTTGVGAGGGAGVDEVTISLLLPQALQRQLGRRWLFTSEIQRIRYELGYNVVQIANPYITTFALFESVIQQYVQGGATTTSSTAVTAATTPTPVALTLASATGVKRRRHLVVDVDDRQERAIISALSAAIATVSLSKAHSGTPGHRRGRGGDCPPDPEPARPLRESEGMMV